MSTKTSIEWTERTWNPVTGCNKISQGCKNCYAETIANRFWKDRKFTDVRCHADRLDEPLHWHKPCRIFVNSMSDLFHEDVPFSFIEKVFDTMYAASWHTYQILTKRIDRALLYFDAIKPRALRLYPLPNVWLGVSVEDQKTADERIPILLQTPAAIRWVSYEPALKPVNFTPFLPDIHWLVIGGESGPGARPFDIAWARNTIAQCRAAKVPVFMKQLGARPEVCNMEDEQLWPTEEIPWDYGDDGQYMQGESAPLKLRSRKGGDPSEWPEDLRIRDYPKHE